MTEGTRRGLIVLLIGAVLLAIGAVAGEGYGEMERNLGALVAVVGALMIVVDLARREN